MACSTCKVIGSVQAQDFTCVKGDDFYLPIQLVDSVTGVPEDISDWTFFFEVYASWQQKNDTDTNLISLSLGHGIEILDGLNGKLSIAITAEQTDGISIPDTTTYGNDVPQTVCVYDFIAVDEDDLTRTTLRGNFTFTL